ncbi:MAG: MarR family transcriptional regulator [bacterium]|nr:MarR family transcriptional regulator [bacterium]
MSNHDGESIQQEVDVFTREVALLYFRMKVAAQQYLGQGRHSTGRRGLLKSLGEEGPQTVPQMARVRAVSRQHIQTVVNELRRDGLAKTKDNPKHRRSKLVTLTSAGHEFLETLHEREGELMSFLGEGISQQDFKQATSLVRLVRERLESEEWTALANPDHLRSQ